MMDPERKTRAGSFFSNLPRGLTVTSEIEMLLLREYGAVFLARNGVVPPTKIVFEDHADVESFQSILATVSHRIDGVRVELQEGAWEGLRNAITEATSGGLTITTRGPDSAKRTYNETVGLWASRVEPALKHWLGKGKITQGDADRIKAMSPFEQVPEVLKLEEKGIFFAKDLSKSIIYSVAPPGTSQHLAMLALDVKEHDNANVRALLAKHNWYQTVVSDLPHFTYLGVAETQLSGLGLKKVSEGARTFWVPAL